MAVPINIGRFRIEALLGSGGMGEVYKAFDPTLKRIVAIKTVRPDIDRPEYLERLYREAQACARLQHKNIVTVYEAGEIEGVVFIAMEFLKGASLDVVLQRGELTFEAKLQVLIEILDALEHAHGEGVIHRDVKPANVHQQHDGAIKLLDFGLARVIRADTLTQSGTVMGTVYYASPEQLRGERLDHRSDLYSTGALAYEVLAGRKPFRGDGDSIGALVAKVIYEPVAPMETAWTRQFPELEQIVARAMEKSPENRFGTASEMREAITAFRDANRDAIAALQERLATSAEETLVQAKALVAQGLKVEASTILLDALRGNPDASDVRTLLDTISAPRPTPPVRSQHAALPAQTPVRESNDAGTAASVSQWPRAIWWPVGAAAVLILLIVGAAMNRSPSGERALVPPVDSGATRADGSSAPSQDAIASRPAVGAPANPLPPPSIGPTTTTPVDAPATAPAAPPRPTAPPGAASPAASPSRVATVTEGPPPAPAERATAKQLFTAVEDSATANAGLKYRVIQQVGEDQRDVDPATTFLSGDRLKFSFESNVDGYLYVVQQGSSGRWDVLFPSPDMNGGRNAVRRLQQYEVPEDGWFLMDDNPGTEQVFVIFSKDPLDRLPGLRSPVTKPESVQASVVQELQQSIKPRDLVFEKDRRTAPGGRLQEASYIVNRDELGKAVTVLIPLKHEKR